MARPFAPRQATALWVALAVSLGLAGCGGCGERPLTRVLPGFTVGSAAIDFGRVKENTKAQRTVRLQSTSRAPATLRVATTGPFTAPTSVALAGGQATELAVTFTAGAALAEGTLTVSVGEVVRTVTLQGTGVRPLRCIPTAPCRDVTFDVESGTCVEEVSADGAACTPADLCLDKGQCQLGECLGAPRTCNDDDRCTVDACAQGFGCFHTPVVCPKPANPCRVAVCGAASGCGDAPAPDLTPCGPVDCVTASLCVNGACQTIATPDGVECAPATPCRGKSTCQAQVCQAPPVAPLNPTTSAPLPMPPAPRAEGASGLLAHEANLFLELCNGGPGGGGGAVDAGCFLGAWTASGFERFVVPHEGAQPRTVVGASSAGVVLLGPDGLEAHSTDVGAKRWTLPQAALDAPDAGLRPFTAKDRIALTSSGEVLATFGWSAPYEDGGWGGDDGGFGHGNASGGLLVAGVQTLVRVGADGGLQSQQRVSGLGEQSLLALGAEEVPWLYEANGALAVARADAGAFELKALGTVPGERSLVTTWNSTWAGARHLVEPDGGVRGTVNWARPGSGEPGTPLPHPFLATAEQLYGAYRACAPGRGPVCAESEKRTTLRAMRASDAGVLWEVDVLGEGATGRIEEAALVQGGGVVALVESSPDGGVPRPHLDLYAFGQKLYECPLPPSSSLLGATFERSAAHAVVERDGGYRLESYNLAPLVIEDLHWPLRDGVSGARRAR